MIRLKSKREQIIVIPYDRLLVKWVVFQKNQVFETRSKQSGYIMVLKLLRLRHDDPNNKQNNEPELFLIIFYTQ